ncbi:hypothetical protein [Actinocatenispora comari]|uniref:Uncharacterized protein n=1 Tax=Actinocatenispora comari TaxID=2807577 RepID=A0A8J4EM24_9ACTN|nr:hypothetical protein [Actinocatenispora comari]GIL29106.1 hypothetical protein NUM_43600 [Actinocatenispora comari]
MIVLIPRLSTPHQADLLDALAGIVDRHGLRAVVVPQKMCAPRIRCEASVRGTVHHRVRLRLLPMSERYWLLGRDGRRIHAVCWHGHRDVLRELFDTWPRATLISALATYRGADDFDVSHQDTQDKHSGLDGRCRPIRECACIEPEHDSGYRWHGSLDSARWTPALLDEQE